MYIPNWTIQGTMSWEAESLVLLSAGSPLAAASRGSLISMVSKLERPRYFKIK